MLRAREFFFFLLEHFHSWRRRATSIPAWWQSLQNAGTIKTRCVFVKAQLYPISNEMYNTLCASPCLFTCSVYTHTPNFNWGFYNMLKINSLLQASAKLSKCYNRPQTCYSSLFLTNHATQLSPSSLHSTLWATRLPPVFSPSLLLILYVHTSGSFLQ